MTEAPGGRPRAARAGFSLIEVAVALAIFGLVAIVMDTVFVIASRAALRVETAADVQQNGRLAMELLTREIRESGADEIVVGGSPGVMAVVFKSARLPADSTAFCLYTRVRTDPQFRSGCFYWPGAPLPPYTTDPPYAAPCDDAGGEPCGTYSPIWQRVIGYYVTDPGAGAKELRRTVVALAAPDAPLPAPVALRGGQAVATYVEEFDASFSGGLFSAALRTKAFPSGQGPAPPAQELVLTGAVLVRN